MPTVLVSARVRLFAEIAMMIALVACDTFGPPPDEGACGRDDAPCATATGSLPPPIRQPNTIPPPTVGIASSGRPSVTSPVGAAGRGGSTATAGGRAVDWNDADAGAEPSLAAIELSARHIVADAARNRIYATVPGNATSYANRLLSIDAKSAKVIRDIPIGSEPNTLALSDDGSTLWVSISGAASVRRVDIAGDELMPAEPNALPTMCLAKPCIAGPMLVLPGTKDRVLVVLKENASSDGSSGIALLVNGAAQTNMLQQTDVFGISALSAGPAGYAYGYNGSNTGYDFFVITISDTNLAVTKHSGLISGFNAELAYRDKFVFASSGDVVDVKMPAAPIRAGRFPMPGAMLPLPGNAGALAISISNAVGGSSTNVPVTLSLMNVDTFTSSKSAVVGTIAGSTFNAPRDLVQVGTGLTFLTGRSAEPSKVYLLQDIGELDAR